MPHELRRSSEAGLSAVSQRPLYSQASHLFICVLLLAFNSNESSVIACAHTGLQRSGGSYLGVYLGDINEERARELKLAEARGAVVGKVEDNSPAARSGLQENDVILTYNDQQVQNRAHFFRFLVESPPGSRVALGLSYRGEHRTVTVELGRREIGFIDERQRMFSEVDAMLAAAEERRKEAEDLRKKGDEKRAQQLLEEEKEFSKLAEERRASIERQIRDGKIGPTHGFAYPNFTLSATRYNIGLSVLPLSDPLAKFFNVVRGGVLVSEVRAGGSAERAGIKAGDCLIAINDTAVASPADFNRSIDRLGKDGNTTEQQIDEVILTIVRDRSEQKIKIKIDKR
jgi:serine protease Do